MDIDSRRLSELEGRQPLAEAPAAFADMAGLPPGAGGALEGLTHAAAARWLQRIGERRQRGETELARASRSAFDITRRFRSHGRIAPAAAGRRSRSGSGRPGGGYNGRRPTPSPPHWQPRTSSTCATAVSWPRPPPWYFAGRGDSSPARPIRRARPNCWAWRIGQDYRSSDDGSRPAGRPESWRRSMARGYDRIARWW